MTITTDGDSGLTPEAGTLELLLLGFLGLAGIARRRAVMTITAQGRQTT